MKIFARILFWLSIVQLCLLAITIASFVGSIVCHMFDIESTFIVECKQSKFLNDNRTIVRQNALEIWCKMHNYIALLLTEYDLQVDVLLTKLV